MRAVAACLGSVSGASRYDRSWRWLRARRASGLMANAAPDQLEVVVAVEDVAADPRGLELHDRVPAHGHDVRLAFPGRAHHDDRPRLEIAPDLRDRKIRFLVGPHCRHGPAAYF